MGFISIRNNIFGNIIILLILIVSEMTEANPHHSDLLDLKEHSHLNLHQDHHHIRVRNVLLGISGTVALIVGAILLYRWITDQGRVLPFDTTFSERGALLPVNGYIVEPTRFRPCWPFSFVSQPGFLNFSKFSTSAIPKTVPSDKVFYNHPLAPNKAYYDPWEQL